MSGVADAAPVTTPTTVETVAKTTLWTLARSDFRRVVVTCEEERTRRVELLRTVDVR